MYRSADRPYYKAGHHRPAKKVMERLSGVCLECMTCWRCVLNSDPAPLCNLCPGQYLLQPGKGPDFSAGCIPGTVAPGWHVHRSSRTLVPEQAHRKCRENSLPFRVKESRQSRAPAPGACRGIRVPASRAMRQNRRPAGALVRRVFCNRHPACMVQCLRVWYGCCARLV